MGDFGVPEPLSAKFTESFAYATVKDRLPAILTKVIDTVHRQKDTAIAEHGEDGGNDQKEIVGRLSKLRNELMTDKPILHIEDGKSDANTWNSYLDSYLEENNGVAPTWFSSPWLYVECYLYRRIQQPFNLSKYQQQYDPFQEQKESSFWASLAPTEVLLSYLHKIVENAPSMTPEARRQKFGKFIMVALWGNKCDLSISGGAENAQESDLLGQLGKFKENILVDDTQALWDTLSAAANDKPGKVRLDVVLDNAAFELLTDLFLVEFLQSTGIVDTVHFHCKCVPWFVSDVVQKDFMWTLKQLQSSSNTFCKAFGKKWEERLENGSWVLKEHAFWTLPYGFNDLKKIAPDLYSDLGQADLVLFKGDLNYRKIVADRNWKTTDPFEVALLGFHPAPLCSLRTLKADVQSGLKEGQAEETAKKCSDWMINGSHAVIQFCGKRVQ